MICERSKLYLAVRRIHQLLHEVADRFHGPRCLVLCEALHEQHQQPVLYAALPSQFVKVLQPRIHLI